MHGNVWEWCSDWCGNYPKGNVTQLGDLDWDLPHLGDLDWDFLDGEIMGPEFLLSGSYRVARGGSWDDSAWDCRSASRYWDFPSSRFNLLGFRLALSPSGAESPEAGK